MNGVGGRGSDGDTLSSCQRTANVACSRSILRFDVGKWSFPIRCDTVSKFNPFDTERGREMQQLAIGFV